MYGAVWIDSLDPGEAADVAAISTSPHRLREIPYTSWRGTPIPVDIRCLRVVSLPPPATNGAVYGMPCMGGETEVILTTFSTNGNRQPLRQDVLFSDGLYNEDAASLQWGDDVVAPPTQFRIPREVAAWLTTMRKPPAM